MHNQAALTHLVGLAVGLQLLAYGGAKPLPFQRGICESQALEPGITGNFTIDAMAELVRYTPCANLPLHSEETIECLRAASTETTLNASLTSYVGDIKHNIGDIWLPVVDGDFLPAPPSQLVKEGRFGNATYMIGWTDGDVNFFTDISIATSNDTLAFIQGYLPAMPAEAVNRLLGLYPVAEFTPPSGTNLTAEFYRAARVFRDIIMVCQPMFLAESIYNRSNMTNTPQNKVYLYDFNQTILEPILEQVYDVSHLGVVHTSEFAYIYGNLSIYNVSGFAFNPTVKDYELVKRASRSWSTFASTGSPSMEGKYTLQGFGPAYSRLGDIASLYIVGGPFQSFSKVAGSMSAEVLEEQKLRRRCAVINSEEFIGYLQY
jgi:carboxylesterase type B